MHLISLFAATVILVALSTLGRDFVRAATVTVIGAGMSGIAAAVNLTLAGHAVTILEARNRIGGRIWTDRSLGFSVDLGASWIHGDSSSALPRNPLLDLAAKYNIPLFHTDDAKTRRFQKSGVEYTDSQVATVEKKVQVWVDAIIGVNAKFKSFAAVLNALDPQKYKEPAYQYTLSELLEFDVGAALEDLSPYAYSAGNAFNGGNSLFPGGYDKILEGLLGDTGINQKAIQFGSVVSTVTTSGDTVKVKYHRQGTSKVITSDFVIVTIPLGVLANKYVTFTPPLSCAKRTAFRNVKMGCTNKYFGVYAANKWDKNVFYGIDQGSTSTARGNMSHFLNVAAYNSRVNGLMSFGFANAARALERLSNADLSRIFASHVTAMFPDDAASTATVSQPSSFLATRWASDPFSMGSYSYLGLGVGSDAFDALASPEHGGRVIFAGEHTNGDYFGTVHAAYLSGQRAAEEVITF